jgi:hypothetical protein
MIYKEVAFALLSSSCNLDVLSTPRARTPLPVNLPSWVPDWSDTSTHPSQLETSDIADGGDLFTERFYASGKANICRPVLKDESTLCIVGHNVDGVCELGRALTFSITDTDLQALKQAFAETSSFQRFVELIGKVTKAASVIRKMLDVFLEWEAIAHADQEGTYPTGEDHLTVYWRTLCTNITPNGPEKAAAAFQRWRRRFRGARVLNIFRRNSESPLWDWLVPLSATLFGKNSNEREFGETLTRTFFRRLVRTNDGYLGLVPKETQVGDRIALLKGGRTPFIVRTRGTAWELIGECYIHGIMRGEKFGESLCAEMELV